jgi:dimeric dUTPase (all-alpha-NTP-PPase superfamily)
MLETLGFDNTSTETLSRYGLALIIEVGEFLNETPWKLWKKGGVGEYDLDRIKEEFVDLISFLGSWVIFLNMMGISTQDIMVAYHEKLEQNNTRFGVTNDNQG